jgi:hypothetical protein
MLFKSSKNPGPGRKLFTGFTVAFHLFLYFSYIATKRFVAADEGFYLLASRLVSEGKELYLDFFYPQMPLFPYLFAGWFNLNGIGWESARILLAVSLALFAFVFFEHLKQSLNFKLALLGLIMFCGAEPIIAWFTVAKPYGLSALLLFVAYLAVKNTSKHKALPLVAGIALAFATNFRLYLCALFPIYFYEYLIVSQEHKKKDILTFSLGFLLGLSPNLYWIIKDFELFYFNNLGYHFERASAAILDSMPSKLNILKGLFAFKLSTRGGFQYALLIYPAIIYIFSCFLRRKRLGLALNLSVAIFLVSFIPSPAFYQYFSIMIPFLLIVLLELIKLCSGSRLWFVFIPLCALYFAASASAIYRYTESGVGVPGVRGEENRQISTISHVDRVSEAITRYSVPGDTVMSFWPGYLLSSDAQALSGMENQFWSRMDTKLSTDELKRYKLISRPDIKEAIRSGLPKLVITDKKRISRFYSGAILSKNGYYPVEEVDRVLIFARTR